MKYKSTRFVTPLQILQLETCAKCANCAEYCPVYDILRRPQVMPGGRASAMLKVLRNQGSSPLRYLSRSPKNLEDYIQDVYYCALCGRCMVVCPFGIQTDNLWEIFRGIVYGLNKHPLILKEVDNFIVSTYNAYGVGNDARATWIDYLGLDKVKINEPSDIVYFVGCTSSFKAIAQDIAYSTSLILNDLGLNWTLLGENEWCCGAPLMMIGNEEGAKVMAKHNVEAIENLGAKIVVSACPGCVRTLKQRYPRLLGKELKFDVMHVVELFERYIRSGKLQVKEKESAIVTYHDPCELSRLYGVIEEPRRIVTSIVSHYREMPERGKDVRCCGGGGILQAVDDELRLSIAKKRVMQASNVGAEILTSACPACKITLFDGAKKSGLKIQVMDLSELLAKQLGLI